MQTPCHKGGSASRSVPSTTAGGLAALAAASSLCLVLKQISTLVGPMVEDSKGDPVPVCTVPVEVIDRHGPRLGCGSDADLSCCYRLAPGDRVRLREQTCQGQAQGMSGELRLLLGLKLDVNRSTAAELTLLPGIGPKLAERIVALRAKRGALDRFEDLLAVRGIGPVTLGRLAPYLEVPRTQVQPAVISTLP